MKAAMIALALGILLIIADWHLATRPDKKAVIRRRKPLSPGDRKNLWDMTVWTAGVAAAVWVVSEFVD